MALVDDGGKITRRDDAYFMAADGTRMTNAYLSGNLVRYVMQFPGIGAQTTSISLVRAGARIDRVPVNAAAASDSGSSAR